MDFPPGIGYSSPIPDGPTRLRNLFIPAMLEEAESARDKDGQESGNKKKKGTGQSQEVPKCSVGEYRLQAEHQFERLHKAEFQALQLFLEDHKESFQECITLEKRESCKEKTDNDA